MKRNSTTTGGPVVVVGPSARFLSGISYYGARLARAFDEHHDDGGAALLLRRLCPERIYPGRERIGRHHDDVLELDGIETFNGLDWYWGRSMIDARRWLRRTQPSVLVLQWWTGTAAHSYLALARAARRAGATVVVEFHETLDVGEARIPGVKPYVRTMMRALLSAADGIVVHSQHDLAAVRAQFPTAGRLPANIIHHGPFDQLSVTPTPGEVNGPIRFVYFGVLRAYKGLDVLAQAFAQVLAEGVDAHLTVAGEPWADAAAGLDALKALPQDRVSMHLAHLSDDALRQVVSDADVVVLPYRRSSASGPLHIAMASGLPVVTTDVPALAEVTRDYTGAVLAQPGDAASLAGAMKAAQALVGGTHRDPHSWEANVSRYRELFERAAVLRRPR